MLKPMILQHKSKRNRKSILGAEGLSGDGEPTRLISALTRPVQAQARQGPSIYGGGSQEAPAPAEDLWAIDAGRAFLDWCVTW